MKPFGMIPFFIPHVGCPYVCTFCNQSRITGQSGISHLTPDYIKKRLQIMWVKNEMISFGRSPLWRLFYSHSSRFATYLISANL